MRFLQTTANLLYAHTSGYEHDAFYLIEIQARRWKDEASTHTHLYLLSLYLLFWLP
jgi:hypothetical protein